MGKGVMRRGVRVVRRNSTTYGVLQCMNRMMCVNGIILE